MNKRGTETPQNGKHRSEQQHHPHTRTPCSEKRKHHTTAPEITRVSTARGPSEVSHHIIQNGSPDADESDVVPRFVLRCRITASNSGLKNVGSWPLCRVCSVHQEKKIKAPQEDLPSSFFHPRKSVTMPLLGTHASSETPFLLPAAICNGRLKSRTRLKRSQSFNHRHFGGPRTPRAKECKCKGKKKEGDRESSKLTTRRSGYIPSRRAVRSPMETEGVVSKVRHPRNQDRRCQARRKYKKRLRQHVKKKLRAFAKMGRRPEAQRRR